MLRIKLEPDRREDWTCFFCCHVRTATIVFGVWHVMLQIMALTALVVVINHPELHEDVVPVKPTSAVYGTDVDNMETPLPTPLSTTNNYAQESHVSTEISFITFVSALAMIYGATKGKQLYILPFFCLKVFDFCITCIFVLTYLCSLPSSRYLERKGQPEAVSRLLHDYNPATVGTIFLLFYLLVLTVKAYILSIIWRCYRFLSLRRASGRATVSVLGTPGMSEFGPDVYAPYPGLSAAVPSGSRSNDDATTTTVLMDNPPEYSKLKDLPAPRAVTPPPPYMSVVQQPEPESQQQPQNNSNNNS